MSPTLCAILVGLGAVPSLGEVGRALEAAWGVSTPGGRFRSMCLITIQHEVSDPALGDSFFPNGSFGSKIKLQTKWIEEIARDRKKFYCYTFFWTGDDRGEIPRGSESTTFSDGTTSWNYMPWSRSAERYPEVSPTTRVTQDYFGDMVGLPSDPPDPSRTVGGDIGEPFALTKLVPSGKYEVRDGGEVDGIACVLLERPGLDRVWLAPGKGWSVVRREWNWTVGGPLKRVIRNTEIKPVAGKVWMPSSCEMEIYGTPGTNPGRRVAVLRAVVREIEVDVPGTWFEPRFPKGTRVIDLGTGETYAYGMKKESLDGAIERIEQLKPMFRPMPWWRRGWVWGVVGVVVAGIVGTWWVRRARDR